MAVTGGTTVLTKDQLGKLLRVVPSYVVEDDNSSLPKRAYSVGSKPISPAACPLCSTGSIGRQSNRSDSSTGFAKEDSSGSLETIEAETGATAATNQSAVARTGQHVCSKHATEQSKIRPRTSTFPADLLRSRVNSCFGGADQAMLSGRECDLIDDNKRRMLISNYRMSYGPAFRERSCRELFRCSASMDNWEYVEMSPQTVPKAPQPADGSEYVDMTFGARSAASAAKPSD